MAMRRLILLCACAMALVVSGNPLLSGPFLFGSSTSLAQEEWKAEFDAARSKTAVAMILSVGELKGMIA
jgi:hypothetical protein